MWDTMKKMKLRTFASARAVNKCKLGDKILELKEERALLTRFLLIQRARPEFMELSKAIGEFEFTAIPRSLFSAEGLMLIPTNKSALMNVTEVAADSQNGGIESAETEQVVFKVVIIDAMVEVQSLKKDEGIKNIGQLAERFCQQIEKKLREANEGRILFDRYIQDSLKEQTRKKRAKGIDPIKFHVKESMDIRRINMKTLLSDTDTKEQLTILFKDTLLKKFRDSEMRIICVAGTTASSNHPGLLRDDMREHDHEEADTLIPLHCLNAATCYPGCSIVVHSVDTDVYVLLLEIYDSLSTSQLHMIVGRGKSQRIIDIGRCYEVLGTAKAKALLGLHAFTGADWGGKFSGISKRKWVQNFLLLRDDDPIITALTDLGASLDSPPCQDIESIERFVCSVYCKTSKSQSLKELRWELFCKGKEAEKLPPTQATLIPHVSRANYVCHCWKNCRRSMQALPTPEGHGWLSENDNCVPVLCLKKPAPNEMLELIKCGCKSDCATGHCSCRKNNLKCTPACSCEDCSNQECQSYFDDNDIDYDSDNSTDSD